MSKNTMALLHLVGVSYPKCISKEVKGSLVDNFSTMAFSGQIIYPFKLPSTPYLFWNSKEFR